jgi:hypothetical protein
MKQCPDCKKEGSGPKPAPAFHINRKTRDGLSRLCREHQNTYARSRGHITGPKSIERARVRRAADPVTARRLSVRRQLKRFYGLTEKIYGQMFADQQGLCRVCNLQMVSQLDETRPVLKFAPNEVARVDHCHKTGRVRGLLCNRCNTLLGKAEDDPKILATAARYLQETATAKTAARQGDAIPDCEIEPRRAGPRIERESRASRRDDLNPFI